MRIALCYYGNVGWKQGSDGARAPLPPDECFASVKRHIVAANDKVDIFVHSWSVDFQEEIIHTLRPARYSIETQREFPKALCHRNPVGSLADLKSVLLEKIRLLLNSRLRMARMEGVQRAYSRWYSTKKVLDHKKAYEKENGFKYDIVMLIRFDIEFYTDIDFQKFDKSCFYSADPSDLDRKRHNYLIDINDPNYKSRDRGHIAKPWIHRVRQKYGLQKTVFWVQPNWKKALLIKLGLAHYNLSDTWFIAGSDVMDAFGLLYDHAAEYNASPHVASYQHITRLIGKQKLRFPFEQFTDFELRRFSKTYGVPHPDQYRR